MNVVGHIELYDSRNPLNYRGFIQSYFARLCMKHIGRNPLNYRGFIQSTVLLQLSRWSRSRNPLNYRGFIQSKDAPKKDAAVKVAIPLTTGALFNHRCDVDLENVRYVAIPLTTGALFNLCFLFFLGHDFLRRNPLNYRGFIQSAPFGGTHK